MNWAAGIWKSDKDVSPACLYRAFEKACAVDDPFGCAMMARIDLDEGESAAQRERGRLHLERSCARLNGPPCRILAMYLEAHRLPFADQSRIPALLEQACAGELEEACGEVLTFEGIVSADE